MKEVSYIESMKTNISDANSPMVFRFYGGNLLYVALKNNDCGGVFFESIGITGVDIDEHNKQEYCKILREHKLYFDETFGEIILPKIQGFIKNILDLNNIKDIISWEFHNWVANRRNIRALEHVKFKVIVTR